MTAWAIIHLIIVFLLVSIAALMVIEGRRTRKAIYSLNATLARVAQHLARLVSLDRGAS